MFESDPRYVLKKVIAEAKEMGYTFDVGPECEFFLFHTDEDGLPTTFSHEKASYFDLGPLDLGENARRDIVLTLEDMGFEVEESHHEFAPAQHEVDFKYDEALLTADNIMTFKLVVKTIAKRHGLHATFMPKPFIRIYNRIRDKCHGFNVLHQTANKIVCLFTHTIRVILVIEYIFPRFIMKGHIHMHTRAIFIVLRFRHKCSMKPVTLGNSLYD